jgi:hypothetical protein
MISARKSFDFCARDEYPPAYASRAQLPALDDVI